MLSNGKVFIDGGILPPDTDTSEIYGPATGSFALAGAGVYAYGDGPVKANLLTSGKVLEISGPGCDDPCEDSHDAVLYDPVASTFTATGSSTSESPNASTVGRNTLRTGGTNNFDLNLTRSIPLASRDAWNFGGKH
jgi:hypothetical protein